MAELPEGRRTASARGREDSAGEMELLFAEFAPGTKALQHSVQPCVLVPARRGAARAALADAVVAEVVRALPARPQRVSDVEGPFVEVTRAAGDGAALDFEVRHHFRAHFDRDAAAPSSSPAPPAATLALPAPAAAGTAPGAGPRIVEVGPDSEELCSGSAAARPAACAAPSSVQEPCAAAHSAPRRGPWELDPGQILMGERLAVGGFSEVFAGKLAGTLVAVKVLLNVDASGRERFLREVALMASLRHPNLLLFMGYASGPRLAIVSEFMHRGSLFGLLRRGRGSPAAPRLARSVAVSVARGMAHLHARSPPLLHLDLKSPNILLDDRYRVKIADFGLSRVRAATFVSGAGGGTPEWMAPEVLRSEPCDEAADVYSYGVVLWELLTGEAPWAELNPMQVVGAVGFMGRALPPPPEGGDAVLGGLCRRCISPAPRDRPSFAEIVQELEAAWGPAQLATMHSTLLGEAQLPQLEGAGSSQGLQLPQPCEVPEGPAAAFSAPRRIPEQAPSGSSLASPFALAAMRGTADWESSPTLRGTLAAGGAPTGGARSAPHSQSTGSPASADVASSSTTLESPAPAGGRSAAAAGTPSASPAATKPPYSERDLAAALMSAQL